MGRSGRWGREARASHFHSVHETNVQSRPKVIFQRPCAMTGVVESPLRMMPAPLTPDRFAGNRHRCDRSQLRRAWRLRYHTNLLHALRRECQRDLRDVAPMPSNMGSPMLDGIENRTAQIAFGIPSCKGRGVCMALLQRRAAARNTDPYRTMPDRRDRGRVQQRRRHPGRYFDRRACHAAWP